MIKKPRTRTSSRTITIRERRAIRRPVSPGLSPLTSHPTFHLADPPTRRYADPLPPASHLSPLTFRRRRPAGPFLPLADTSPRRPAVPPIRRFADPFLPHPLSRLFACFAGPSVFVSPNRARRSLIPLTGA